MDPPHELITVIIRKNQTFDKKSNVWHLPDLLIGHQCVIFVFDSDLIIKGSLVQILVRIPRGFPKILLRIPRGIVLSRKTGQNEAKETIPRVFATCGRWIPNGLVKTISWPLKEFSNQMPPEYFPSNMRFWRPSIFSRVSATRVFSLEY